jgi:dihydroceramidase
MSFLKRSDAPGLDEAFWGLPTASVDWCETNYNVTPYIAEFFNTLSSVAMVWIAVQGMLLHPWAERKFQVAFLTIAIGTATN